MEFYFLIHNEDFLKGLAKASPFVFTNQPIFIFKPVTFEKIIYGG